MLSRSLVGCTAGAILALVVGAPAHAGTEVPNFLMTWDVTGDTVGEQTYNWMPKNGGHGTLNPFGDYTVPKNGETWTGWNYTGDLSGPQDAWNLHWDCIFYDASGAAANGATAFVVAHIVVTNNSMNTENFTLQMTQPLAKMFANPTEQGSIAGTVTDIDGDDATVSAPTGASIYTAMIDLADEAALMSDPFSENAGGANKSNTVGPESFGVIPASQSADDSIGIFLNFDLTSNDQASFTAVFEIFPSPAGLPVLAAFGLLAGRRRRRS